jgi:hypothetical protein
LFFEKKNQKTFASWAEPKPNLQKFFASFFQKRRLFLISLQPKRLTAQCASAYLPS